LPDFTLHRAMNVAVTATSAAIVVFNRDSRAFSTASFIVSAISLMATMLPNNGKRTPSSPRRGSRSPREDLGSADLSCEALLLTRAAKSMEPARGSTHFHRLAPLIFAWRAWRPLAWSEAAVAKRRELGADVGDALRVEGGAREPDAVGGLGDDVAP